MDPHWFDSVSGSAMKPMRIHNTGFNPIEPTVYFCENQAFTGSDSKLLKSLYF